MLDDNDYSQGDALDDLGFFALVLCCFAGLAAVLYWVVPEFVRWIAS